MGVEAAVGPHREAPVPPSPAGSGRRPERCSRRRAIRTSPVPGSPGPASSAYSLARRFAESRSMVSGPSPGPPPAGPGHQFTHPAGHGPTGLRRKAPEPALAKAGGGGRFDHAPQHRGGPPRTQRIGVVTVAARQRHVSILSPAFARPGASPR